MKLILLLLTCLLTLLPTVAKDDYRCRSITMNDGLPSNAVRNIVQDRHGFIWLGTDNGLCRYDGVRIVSYPIKQLGMNQYVSALLPGDDGVYIGSEQGVFLLNTKEAKLERLPIDIHTTVTCLVKDMESSLWIATYGQGLWHYQATTGKVTHYDFEDTGGIVSDVLVDRDNQLWTASSAGTYPIHKLNRLHSKFVPVNLRYDRPYNSLSMLQSRDGRLWLGSWEEGLLLIHADGHLEQVLSPSEAKTGSHIHTLFQLSDDQICIGCDDGTICLNTKTRAWQPLNDVLQLGHDGNEDRFVYAITSDTEGGLWMGTYYNGVKYISPVARRFEAFSKRDNGIGLEGNVISRFCEDRKGNVWIASDDGGLMCFEQRTGRIIDYPHREVLSQRNVHALCIVGDDLWIGTYTDGVYVLDTKTGQLRQYSGKGRPDTLGDTSAYAIYCDSNGTIWVATMKGLSRYDRQKDQFEQIGALNAMTIDIDEDRRGDLWLSTQGAGLWRYSRKTGKLQQYQHIDNDSESLPDNQVNGAIVDESGKLWIGTMGGLCRYNAAGNKFESTELDKTGRSVMGIVESQGALWLATDKGIARYQAGAGIQLFTSHDGLLGEQAQPNAMTVTSEGRIFAGTTNGFSTFYPSRIMVNTVIPPVYITSMQFLNREEQTAEGLPHDLSQTEKVIIGYGDSRMVSFSFASLSFCSPAKNQYAYMLEGYDNDWNYVGSQNRASYTNLPAGTYTFKVKATNNDGIWSDREATLQVVVCQPFWWSWYVCLLYLVLIGAAIGGYLYNRKKQARHRHRLMEKFGTQPLEPVAEIAGSQADDEFLERMNKMIEDNLSNPELSISFLAEQLNISRSGLFAKIKTLTDATPNEMIQIVRLKRAAQLLNEGGHLVNEVGYMVGFSNPSYFSKCFQKQFGITPGDYMKSNRKRETKKQ